MKKNSPLLVNKIVELTRYYDLGYILNNMESLITLPNPYKAPKMSNKQFETNLSVSKESRKNAKIAYDNIANECQLRKETFEYIRTMHPTFATQISKSMSQEEYQEYLFLLKSCSKNITKLIQSLSERKRNYNELLMDKKDFISSIVDSDSTSRLTFMQDNFVLNELNSIDYSNMDPNIIKNIEKIKEDLNRRISRYNEFQKFYKTNNTIRIKSSPNLRKDERE